MIPATPDEWLEWRGRLASLGIALAATWDDQPAADVPLAPSRPPPRQLSYFSSGTTGAAKEIPYTAADWNAAVEARANCLDALGLRAGMTVLVLASHGPWFSGDNIAQALMRLGCKVVCGGAYAPHLAAAARLLTTTNASALVATPTAAQYVAARLETPVALAQVVTIGECTPAPVRDLLVAAFMVSPRAIYASSECIIGPECRPGCYAWDPQRLCLEVLTEGGIRGCGSGELLVTARYGEAQVLVRYRLGDLVELTPPRDGVGEARFLGRIGHAFSLATGVKVSRSQIEAALADFPAVTSADFTISHGPDGRDEVAVTLSGDADVSATDMMAAIGARSIDFRDAVGCGFVTVATRHRPAGERLTKRFVTFEERPWTL